MKKFGIIAAAVAAVALTLGAPAAAMADPYAPVPGQGNQSVAPGATITLTTAGWQPSEAVTITYPDSFTLAASTVVAANGSGVASVNFASSSAAGTYSVVFTGATSGTITLSVTVDPALAYTGSADPAPYLWLGGGALALGIAAIVTVAVVRRERAADRVGA